MRDLDLNHFFCEFYIHKFILLFSTRDEKAYEVMSK